MPLYRIPAQTPHLKFDIEVKAESYEDAIRKLQNSTRNLRSEILPLDSTDSYIHFVILEADTDEHYIELCSLGDRTEYGTISPDRVTCPDCIKILTAPPDTKAYHVHSRSRG